MRKLTAVVIVIVLLGSLVIWMGFDGKRDSWTRSSEKTYCPVDSSWDLDSDIFSFKKDVNYNISWVDTVYKTKKATLFGAVIIDDTSCVIESKEKKEKKRVIHQSIRPAIQGTNADANGFALFIAEVFSRELEFCRINQKRSMDVALSEAVTLGQNFFIKVMSFSETKIRVEFGPVEKMYRDGKYVPGTISIFEGTATQCLTEMFTTTY